MVGNFSNLSSLIRTHNKICENRAIDFEIDIHLVNINTNFDGSIKIDWICCGQ